VYSHDAGIMPKGMLSDEYGFKPETCRWVIGGLDWPLKPIDFIPHTHPANVQVINAPKGKDLGAMLDAGEIDALISANVPKCMLDGSPKVARLFAAHKSVEREYYKCTGIFPIMHTVVIRKDLLAKHPELAKTVYDGFCGAKTAAVEQYKHGLIFNNINTMFPWFSDLINEDREVLGEDWWPYGIEANRKAIEAVLRYHFEQASPRSALSAKTSSYQSCLQHNASPFAHIIERTLANLAFSKLCPISGVTVHVVLAGFLF
jgi:hypothetical protein